MSPPVARSLAPLFCTFVSAIPELLPRFGFAELSVTGLFLFDRPISMTEDCTLVGWLES